MQKLPTFAFFPKVMFKLSERRGALKENRALLLRLATKDLLLFNTLLGESDIQFDNKCN